MQVFIRFLISIAVWGGISLPAVSQNLGSIIAKDNATSVALRSESNLCDDHLSLGLINNAGEPPRPREANLSNLVSATRVAAQFECGAEPKSIQIFKSATLVAIASTGDNNWMVRLKDAQIGSPNSTTNGPNVNDVSADLRSSESEPNQGVIASVTGTDNCTFMNIPYAPKDKYKRCVGRKIVFWEKKERQGIPPYYVRIRKTQIPFPPPPKPDPIPTSELSKFTGERIDRYSLMFCNGLRESVSLSWRSVRVDSPWPSFDRGEGSYRVAPGRCRQVGKYQDAQIVVNLSIGPKGAAPSNDLKGKLPAFKSQSDGPEMACFPTGGYYNGQLPIGEPPKARFQNCEQGYRRLPVTFHAVFRERQGEEIIIGDYTEIQRESDEEAFRNTNSGNKETYWESMCTDYVLSGGNMDKPYWCD